MRHVSRVALAAAGLSLIWSCLPLGWTVTASAGPDSLVRVLPHLLKGHAGRCDGDSGVTVVVNFKAFHGGIKIRCAPGHPDNGIQALRQAGYTVKGTKQTGLAFVCRINRKPSPKRQKCITIPPANAYWAYYHAKRKAKKWTYSSTGPLSYHPPQGSIEAWAWGDSRKPGITPQEVRQSRSASPTPRPSSSNRALATMGPSSSVAAAGAYLSRQLRARPALDYLGYDDFGLVADAVMALDSAGLDSAQTARSISWLAGGFSSYVGSGPHVSAGALAKLLVVADVGGRDPSSFGGHDLTRELASLMDPTGRYVDQPPAGDLSNTFTQSLAVLGLAEADRNVPRKAVHFLLGQQCGSGGAAGFRLLMATKPCTDTGQADVDSTAMAVRALLAAGQSASAARGLTWLEHQQTATGGLAGSPPTDLVNANSTGLALAALAEGNRERAAALAADYLASLQIGCSVPRAVQGAVSYSKRHHVQDLRHPRPTQELTRSTTQALIGLAVFSSDARPAADSRAACGPDGGATTATTPAPTAGAPVAAGAAPESGSDPWSVLVPVGAVAGLILVAALFWRRRHGNQLGA
jgi:hypothetical protein